jgi:rhamnose transport system permease protein
MSAVLDNRSAPKFDTVARRSDVLLRARELGIILVLVAVFAITTVKNHAFANRASVQQLLAGASLIALLAVGQTLVVVTRNVDLSVGSTLGLSAYVVGMAFRDHHGMPIGLGFVIGIGVGLLVGAINGIITAVAKVPSLVVTLAMLYIIRGVDAKIVNGKQIDPSSIPRSFQVVGYDDVFGIPWLAIIVTAIVLIVGYAMRSFRAGRDLYAIGSNPDSAVLAGVPSGRRIFTAFVISGGLAGLGGALFLAQFATVSAVAGNGYELNVVAAVVVGGVAIFGGSGTVYGAALGALLLNTINQALVAARVSAFWNQAVAGGLLLAAITFDRSLALRVERREAGGAGVRHAG